LAPTSLAFGGQPVSTSSAAKRVTVTNSGSAPLTVGSVTIAGTNAGDYRVTANGCSAGPVAPGAACSVDVSFAPTATGSRSATLTLSDNAPDSPQSVPLSGTGTAPAVSLAPASLAFGDQQIFSVSAPRTVTVTNSGDAPLAVGSVTVIGTNAADYRVASDSCSGASVLPAQSCAIKVTFTPSALSAESATLKIASNALSSPDSVPMTGKGVLLPGVI
jgi:urease beta subunit